MTRGRQLPGSVMAAIKRQDAGAERPRNLRVLGIDTSLRSTGVGVVDFDGTSMRCVDCRPIKNKPKAPLSACLQHLGSELGEYLRKHKPDEVALEGIFYFRNARTALLLGHARGVMIAECAKAGLPVYEYAPTKIKQAVTGTGSATKTQIQRMMMRYLNLQELPQEDAGDALAIAITHIHNISGVAELAPEPI